MIIPTLQDYIRHEIVCAKALTAFKVLHISFAAVRKKIPIYFSNNALKLSDRSSHV